MQKIKGLRFVLLILGFIFLYSCVIVTFLVFFIAFFNDGVVTIDINMFGEALFEVIFISILVIPSLYVLYFFKHNVFNKEGVFKV